MLNPQRPIAVGAGEDGAPAAILVPDGRLAVAEVAGLWRVEDDWWRAPIGRSYHRLLLEDGRQLTLFRDEIAGRWFAQRYDVRRAPSA